MRACVLPIPKTVWATGVQQLSSEPLEGGEMDPETIIRIVIDNETDESYTSIDIISRQLYLHWYHLTSFPSIRLVIHPSKFLIPEEEDDGRRGGGRRMAAVAVYYSKIILKENF